jgi:hypothetical protein
MSNKNLLKLEQKLLKKFAKENALNFRNHKYFDQSHFCNFKQNTYFNYDFAGTIVLKLNRFLVKEFGDKISINFSIEVDKLRTQTLREYIESRINDYFMLIL